MYDILSSVVVLRVLRADYLLEDNPVFVLKMPVMPPDLSIYMHVIVCIHYKLLLRMACYCCMPLSAQT